MTNKTRYYSSAQLSAPVLSGTAGSLLAVLDAVLVNGWGSQSASSAVVLSGVATVTFATAHAHIVDGIAAIAGATPAALNGDKRVLSATTNSISFAAAGISDQTATGSITAKVAPLGWAKPYSGTNLAAYKPTAAEATGCLLRVDDTGTTTARVRGYESMADVNTGSGPFPTLAQQALPGRWWSKSSAASAAARNWTIIGDDRCFFLFTNPSATSTDNSQGVFFGDFISVKSNDPYACFLFANLSDRSGITSLIGDSIEYSNGTMSYGAGFVARLPNSLGGSQGLSPESSFANIADWASGQGGYTYPSPVDNGLTLTQQRLSSTPQGIRGYLPGIRLSPQTCAGFFSPGDVVYGSGTLAGVKLRAVKTGATATASSGVCFFDVLNDWR
jgi:hypothetical protein